MCHLPPYVPSTAGYTDENSYGEKASMHTMEVLSNKLKGKGFLNGAGQSKARIFNFQMKITECGL